MSKSDPILHTPYDLGIDLPCDPRGQLRLSHRNTWGANDELSEESLVADFNLTDDFSNFIRIAFDQPTVFRVLDETWLSTSTNPSRWTGDLTTFARTVQGDDFAELHSFFFEIVDNAVHYQFVTGTACLDVISGVPPRVSLFS